MNIDKYHRDSKFIPLQYISFSSWGGGGVGGGLYSKGAYFRVSMVYITMDTRNTVIGILLPLLPPRLGSIVTK